MSPNQAAALIFSIYAALILGWHWCWRELRDCEEALRRTELHRDRDKEDIERLSRALRDREDLIFLLQNKLARLESSSAATTEEVPPR